MVGRGSGIAKDFLNAKRRFTDLFGATPKNCRAVGCATHGSAAFGPGSRHPNEAPFPVAKIVGYSGASPHQVYSPLADTPLRLNMSLTDDLIFINGQFLQGHRAAGMQPIRADTDLRSEAELSSVIKPR
jgi:hypothetical protein